MKRIHALPTAALLALVGTLSFGAPAMAQDDEDTVTVTAPYTVHHHRDRSGEGDVVAVSQIVTTDGLDLRYDNDVATLDQRISDTAYQVCERAEDYLRGASATTDRECIRRAIREARPQENFLIDRARS